ncbi:MAG: hypothetical protein RI894_414 [Bacteroidota bacterium]|jgi:hypothetical protein
MKNEVTRNYSISDSDMIQLSRRILAFLQRDLLFFQSYGYTPITVSSYKLRIDNFSNMPTDLELLGDQEGATSDKTILRNMLLNKLRNMRERVKLIFEEGSGRYNKFGFAGLSSISDNDLVQAALRAVRCGHQYQVMFANVGIDIAYLDDVRSVADDYQDTLLTQVTTMSDRDIATEDRREAGNVLYAEVVKHAEIGKTIWSNIDEAKYNDYVIYN